ncbi:MAG: hypothetical protein U1E99_00045 [Agitococcus sp.]
MASHFNASINQIIHLTNNGINVGIHLIAAFNQYYKVRFDITSAALNQPNPKAS